MDKMTTPPTWDEAKEAVLHNRATPIHELVYYFQPPATAVNEMSRQELFRGLIQDIISQRQEEDEKVKIPNGWKLSPSFPTEKMKAIGNQLAASYGIHSAVLVFVAMLEAAPKPETQENDQ